MNNPLDELASEYVLGTLPAEQRAEVEQRLPHDAELRAAVHPWEQRPLPRTAPAETVLPSSTIMAAYRTPHRQPGRPRPLVEPAGVVAWHGRCRLGGECGAGEVIADPPAHRGSGLCGGAGGTAKPGTGWGDPGQQ